MAELSKVQRTNDAIIIQRDKPNSKAFEQHTIVTEQLTAAYQRSLEIDAQLIRSEKLATTGELISTEQVLIEASRNQRSQMVYFTSLQEKVARSREQLFGGFDGE